MDEDKITTHETIAETLQEQFMCARKGVEQPLPNFVWRHCSRASARNNAVRRQRLKGAELNPVTDSLSIIPKKPLEDGFMIAPKADRVSPDKPHCELIQYSL